MTGRFWVALEGVEPRMGGGSVVTGSAILGDVGWCGALEGGKSCDRLSTNQSAGLNRYL